MAQETRVEALDAEIASLEGEVRRLVALSQIQDLRTAYYTRVNEGEFERLAELFAEDAKAEFDNDLGAASGRREIVEKLSSLKSSFILQFPHTHMVDVDGDSASGHLFTEGRLIVGNASFITAGKVSDTYVRREGRWLIQSTVHETYYAVPLSEGWAASEPIRPYSAP